MRKPRSPGDRIETMLDPQSAGFAANPYDLYALLRQQEEPHYYEETDSWLLSRYDAVDNAARDPRFVRSLEAFMNDADIAAARRRMNWHDMPNHARFVQVSLLDSDGDTHFRLRLLVLRELSRQFVEHQRNTIQRYVDTLIDELVQRREIDFIADLAAHVPGHVIGHVLGVPDDDCPQLRVWSENVVQFFDVGRTDAHKRLAENATTEFYLYLKDLIADRRRQPRDDLVSRLIAARDDGELDETELVSTCMLVLMAGHGSTIDVLGTGLYALLQHPGEMDRLRQNPRHIATAVQEMFRYESPLPFFHRYAVEDVDIMGRRFPAGTRIGLLYGSANRDENAFPAADRFDVSRQPNRHLAFGKGAHLCLGNHLARLDMEIIFLTLIRRLARIELAGNTPTYKRGLSVRGLESLAVRFIPA